MSDLNLIDDASRPLSLGCDLVVVGSGAAGQRLTTTPATGSLSAY